MALNWYAKDTYHLVDASNNMMINIGLPWSVWDQGKGDAIGGTFDTFIAYGDKRFITGIKNCWVRKDGSVAQQLIGKDYYYQGYRYPDHDPTLKNISRDHTTYSILAFKAYGYSDTNLMEFVSHVPFKISDATEDSRTARFTPNMWLWARAVAGSKVDESLYYSVEIPLMKVVSTWKKWIYRKYNIPEESRQEDFYMIPKEDRPEKMVKWADTCFPTYALHQSAWQVHMLPDSDKKRELQRVMLSMVPKHNYAIKMLLGDKTSFTEADVMSYRPMTGGRWTNNLIPQICNRWTELVGVPGVAAFPDPKFIRANNVDVDYVRKLYDVIVVKNSSFRNYSSSTIDSSTYYHKNPSTN